MGGPGGLATVTGQQKLVQDLRCWILESRGTDPMHPDYGSIIEGGVLPDGSLADPMVGQLIDAETATSLEAEIRRILGAYQQQQVNRINQENITYAGKNTYGLGELLAAINDVSVVQVADTVLVQVTITTADGDALTFSQPLN